MNDCSEVTREENKEMPFLSHFPCIMATLSGNSIEYNGGPVYGNITASERGHGY